MVTIISASNRDQNLTALFAIKCSQILKEKGIPTLQFNLDEIPEDLSLKSVYDYGNSIFSQIAQEYIAPSEKLLFVLPEYNGSMPGILKLFIDAIEPKVFQDKKAALVGVAAGRAGNLRGMDHLTDVLNHLQVVVMPQKLPISKMYDMLEGGEVVDETTIQELSLQMDRLIRF